MFALLTKKVEKMLRAYKYRIYPNDEQIAFIRQNVGANRWFYNYVLNKINEHYEKTGEHLSCQNQVARDIPKLKKEAETEWLKNVDSKSLIWTSMYVDSSFKNFFKSCKNRKSGKKDDGGKPSFKRKSYYGSYTTYQGIKVFWNKDEIDLPKLKHVKCILHRKFNGKIRQATISFNNANQYFVSILVDDAFTKKEEKAITPETVKGIDLGVKNSIITSDGIKYENINKSKEEKKKVKQLHKRLSKKQKGSKNFEKARVKLAKYENKLNNKKCNKIDNITHDLAYDADTAAICLENLNVKGMLKNHNISGSIADSSLSEIKRKLNYKANWNGIKIVEVDRFYPSSKTCHKCGYVNKELTLNDREWICPACGEHHDRDINAAINIKNEGVRLLTEAQQ